MFRLFVTLSTAPQSLDAGSEAAPTTILGEVLSADGAYVVASRDAAPYEFPGLDEGEYLFRASGLDSRGDVMGVPFQVRFSANDATAGVAEPGTGETMDVELPAGATLSITRE